MISLASFTICPRKPALLAFAVAAVFLLFLLPSYHPEQIGRVLGSVQDKVSSESQQPDAVLENQIETQTETQAQTQTDTQTEAQNDGPNLGPFEAVNELDLLPSEYTFDDFARRQCENMYSRKYLTSATTRGQSYCDPTDNSRMHCFWASKLTEPWNNQMGGDPLCIAEGVWIKETGRKEGSTRDIELQCQLSNVSTTDLDFPFQNPSLLDYSYYFDTGVGPQLHTWKIDPNAAGGSGCSKDAGNGKWILLARREGNKNVWHKLMEIWQAQMTLDILHLAVNPWTGKPYLGKDELSKVEIVFEDDLERPYDYLWTMLTGEPAKRKSAMEPGCYERVILPLAGSSSPFWSLLLGVGYKWPCRMDDLLEPFRRRIFSFLEITPREPKDIHMEPTITIVNRTKTRQIHDLPHLVDVIRERYPKSRVDVIDFAELTHKEQIQLVQDTDVFVGHHGAGLVHTLFVNPDAAIVELLPPYFGSTGFRQVGRSRGLPHFTMHCIYGEQWEALQPGGKPLPEDWEPHDHKTWQKWPWTYVAEDEFMELVDAGVKSQQWKRNRPSGSDF
ncbi:uncharacterized protein MKZ38_006656 [Zalerion maritima]|uniref:EGF domain-specific O-linked N-acetylglucosamine transferase n=1 Tax=Zalerion maritima TaxID=339359 RepID=A0AAD5RXB4_9PEZI|nr:uncharacterized protein MKZ38_006656 [Zalerion maritima]